ncbi:MAG: FG-GAP repeat protein, partial [Planctomycetota bacterium]
MKRRSALVANCLAVWALCAHLSGAEPTCETQKVLADEQDDLDIFGRSISVSGDVAIVGAWNDEGEGVPGVFAVGAAYVFRREGSEWIQEARLIAPDAASEDRFGHVVSIHEDVAVVGAPTDDDACPGFPNCDSGSAYVFRFGDDGWALEEKLTPSDGESRDQFGLSLAVHDGVIAIGSPWEDEACGGSPGCNAGAIYMYRYDPESESWIEEEKLMAGDAESMDQLAFSVALHSGGVIAGAPTDDDDGVSSGAVYFFEYQVERGRWAQVQKLRASDAALGDHFGRAVDMDGERLVVGAVFDDDACRDDDLCDSGSAYVFRRTEAEREPWVEEGKLVADDGAKDDEMGEAVSISGDVAVVGRRWDDTIEEDAGSAYVFRLAKGRWAQERKIVAGGVELRDRFGESVSVDRDHLWISAPSDDDAGNGSGAVYAYECKDSTRPSFARGDSNADGTA